MTHTETLKELVEKIKIIAIEKGLTISVAESLTSGNIQSAFASISGASKFFIGGITTYNINQKVEILKVDRFRAEPVNCVSAYVANQMAVGCLDLFKSDISIGITGYSEPFEQENIETPFCYYSIGYKGTVIDNGEIESITNDRTSNIKLFTHRVIQKLYIQINEL